MKFNEPQKGGKRRPPTCRPLSPGGGCRVVKSYVVSTSIPSDPGRHRPPERPAPRRCTPAGRQRSLPATGAWTPSHDPPAGGPPQIPASEAPADPAGPPGSPRWTFPGRRRAGCPWGRRGRCSPTPGTKVARLSTFSTMGSSSSSSSMGLFLLLYQKRRPKGRLLCVWCAGVDHSAEII